jgi:hypothetical protein
MCDTISTSIILGALALLPGTTSRSFFLALACMPFIFLAARHQAPAQKFTKLEDAIEALEDILNSAKAASSYARNHMEVIDAGCRLLQYVLQCHDREFNYKTFRIKFSASKIQASLLEMRSATWKIYLKNMRAILQTIGQCAKEVKEIQTAMLVSVFVFIFS